MKKMMMFALVCAASACATAKVRLATPFADGMVLQRDAATAVWGTADAGEEVTVSFAGQTVKGKADAHGKWLVRLAPMAASKEGRVLRANEATVSDVLVGEVWFCCGQSNTELPLCGDNPHFSDREGRLFAAMTNYRYVRFAYASNYRWSVTPRERAQYPVAWKAFTPENLGTAPSLSAMGVYFAAALYAALDIPVGIVGSYWGGTNIDAWTPREGYEGAPESLRPTWEYPVVTQDKWNDACKKGPIHGPQQQPCVLWNEMVAPWCPMTMKGFIWYQGCHNGSESHLYCDKMHALYNGWSKKFENPGLKLYFVQLAPWKFSWWGLQMAQAKFAAEEKNAGMVTSVDVGNAADIHPVDKGPLGRRLAALALNRDYGFDKLVADAPTVASVTRDGENAVVACDHAKGWYLYNFDWSVEVPFEIAGPDGVWKPAWLVNCNGGVRKAAEWQTRGNINGDKLVLRADGVTEPKRVRYLFNAPWVGHLYADSGLPLGPFEAEVR